MKRVLFVILLLCFASGMACAATCATPTVAPTGGTVNNTVTTGSVTAGASCTHTCYTVDGSTPTGSGTSCTNGTYAATTVSNITVTPYTAGTGKLIAIMVDASRSSSSAVTQTYTFTVATPTFSSNGSASPLNNDVSETITYGTTGGTNVYCLGTSSCTPGTSYSSAVTLPGSGSWTQGWYVRASATKTNYNNSAVATTTNPFTFTAATPTFSQNGGSTYNNDLTETITFGTTGATNTYCLGISTCTPGTSYSSALTLPGVGSWTQGWYVGASSAKTNYNTATVHTTGAFTFTVGAVTASPTAPYTGANTSVTLSITTTTGATTYYRTDGTAAGCTDSTGTPSLSSSTVPSQSITLTAVACKLNYNNSSAFSGVYTIQTLAAPTFDHGPATYNNDEAVTISQAGGTTTKYCHDTVNNCDPLAGTTGTSYTIVATGTYLRAIATETNYNNSAVQSGGGSPYVLKVATPTYTDVAGTYNNDLTETISDATTSVTSTLYCTDLVNSCTPSTSGTSASITATGTYLRAKATKTNYVDSDVASSLYTFQVATPTFGTNGGSFNNDTSTTFLSTTTGTVVFCSTLDGSTPAAASPPTCSAGATGASATVIATGTQVKVLGTKANYVNSAVATSSAFTLTVGAVTDSPGAGTYTSAQTATLGITTTTGGILHYTTDNSAATCSSTSFGYAASNEIGAGTTDVYGSPTVAYEATGESFVTAASLITGVEVKLLRQGSPLDGVYATIEDALNGGNVLGTSATIPYSSISIDIPRWITFTFTPAISATIGNTYYMRVWRTGPADTVTNWYLIAYNSGDVYASGNIVERGSGTWYNDFGDDLVFRVDAAIAINSTAHIRAVGCKPNYVTSAEIDDLYTINPFQPALLLLGVGQ